MKIKDLIAGACELINRNDICEYLTSGVCSSPESMNKEVNVLLCCFNLIENEIALDYTSLKCVENFESENGVVFYADFLKTPLEILNVYDEFANKVKFKTENEFLKCKPGKVKVEYSYSPTKKSLDGESDFDGKISERIFAYGIACEYSLVSGMYDEASVFDKKYKDALKSAITQKSGKILKARKWF